MVRVPAIPQCGYQQASLEDIGAFDSTLTAEPGLGYGVLGSALVAELDGDGARVLVGGS